MKYIYLVLVLFILVGCKNEEQFAPRTINTVEVEVIYEDSLFNIRALDFNDNHILYGNSDHIGKIALRGENKINISEFTFSSKKNHFRNILTYKDKPLPFRAISEVNGIMFSISIGNPARLYKLNRKATEPQLVYEETHENVFYDSMDFWNDQEGIAIGDPTEDCMSIIITRDGGHTWAKLSCNDLPKIKDGEAAFAASDTNIAIIGNKTWVATGGKVSRVLFSPDKGKTWEVFNTPIVQGLETTGIYSLDFYDKQNGFAIGGDFTKPEDNAANKIKTQDGGKTWEVVGANQEPGYRSCVQYIPNRAGQELVAVGFKGVDYSSDAGKTWTHLSDESFYTIRFLNKNEAYAAGKGRISKLTFKE